MTMQELVKCGIVPSLYVRVYRGKAEKRRQKNCSITIREGVSH